LEITFKTYEMWRRFLYYYRIEKVGCVANGLI